MFKDYYSIGVNSSMDVYEGLFEVKPSLVFFVSFATAGIPVVILLLYSIIWYEYHGSDLKRTIINRMVTHICWCLQKLFWLLNITLLKGSVSVGDTFKWRHTGTKPRKVRHTWFPLEGRLKHHRHNFKLLTFNLKCMLTHEDSDRT